MECKETPPGKPCWSHCSRHLRAGGRCCAKLKRFVKGTGGGNIDNVEVTSEVALVLGRILGLDNEDSDVLREWLWAVVDMDELDEEDEESTMEEIDAECEVVDIGDPGNELAGGVEKELVMEVEGGG